MYANILSYRSFYYLKLALMLVLTALLLYLVQSPAEAPNGGTWLGYILGGSSAMLLFFLIWFGIRKRQYNRTENNLAGWASAHIYLGGALIIIATLHCGFQFGWNVHTLTYALLMFEALSGFYGLYLYLVIPATMTANRQGMSQREMIGRIAGLDDQGLMLAAALGETIHQLMLLTVEGTRIDGSSGHHHAGRGGHGCRFLSWFVRLTPWFAEDRFRPEVRSADSQVETFLNRFVADQHEASQMKHAAELLAVCHERRDLLVRAQRDLRFHKRMKNWLFLHVPCAVALLAALTVHVVSVFFYW